MNEANQNTTSILTAPAESDATIQGRSYSFYPVDKLVDNSVTDFDLFISLESHFILYSGRGYKWQRAELNDLMHSGHSRLYIRQEDMSRAAMYESVVKLPQIRKELAPAERLQEIEQLGAKFTQCMFDGEVTEACVDKARTIANDLTECVLEDKSCVKHLGNLAGHDYYTYFHSIRVSAYATATALAMGLTDPELLKQVALGGIFHDVGKKEVPLLLLNKSGPLTDAEWSIMRSHPRAGHEHVSHTILSHVPCEIVLHHHEKRNGNGYPHGLDKGSLLPEVQIATLADIFDALTSSRAYQNKRSRFEALDFIKNKLLKEEVCPESYRALITCLVS